jgi:hypothetical protein
MTARERLLLIHKGEKRRRGIRGISWAPWVNQASLAGYTEEVRSLGINGFIARVGGDVFNYYGTCWTVRYGKTLVLEHEGSDGSVRREYRTPVGSLFETLRGQIHTEWRLKGEGDYAAARYAVEDTVYLPDYAAYAALDAQIGERGIAFPYLPASPVQEMIQRYAGVEGFAYHLADHREAVESLMDAMQRKNEELYRIAAASPAPFLMTCENTSTRLTSPSVFRDYSRKHLSRFAAIAHSGGKTALAHMCGHIRDMLPLIRGTGLDGLNYVTPPPLGDTEWSEVFRVLGDDFIVDAAVQPDVWLSPRTLEEVRRNAAALVSVDLLGRNLALTAGADGIAGIPLERFEAVSEALAPYGF